MEVLTRFKQRGSHVLMDHCLEWMAENDKVLSCGVVGGFNKYSA